MINLEVPFTLPKVVSPRLKTRDSDIRVPKLSEVSDVIKKTEDCKIVYFPAVDYMQERLSGEYSIPSVVDIINAEVDDPMFTDNCINIKAANTISVLQDYLKNDELRASVVGVFHFENGRYLKIDKVYYIILYRITKEGE